MRMSLRIDAIRLGANAIQPGRGLALAEPSGGLTVLQCPVEVEGDLPRSVEEEEVRRLPALVEDCECIGVDIDVRHLVQLDDNRLTSKATYKGYALGRDDQRSGVQTAQHLLLHALSSVRADSVADASMTDRKADT